MLRLGQVQTSGSENRVVKVSASNAVAKGGVADHGMLRFLSPASTSLCGFSCWRYRNRGGGQAKYDKDAVAEMWLALNPNGRMAT
jgi:hypothetical protein